MRGLSAATKSSPCSLQLEKPTQKQRLSTAINKQKIPKNHCSHELEILTCSYHYHPSDSIDKGCELSFSWDTETTHITREMAEVLFNERLLWSTDETAVS